jgi:hypothetical protein
VVLIAKLCVPVQAPFSSRVALNPGCGFISLAENPWIVLIG